MFNKRTIKMIIISAGLFIGLTGCEKSGFVEYSGGNTVGFWIHSINYSLYGADNSELSKDTVILDLAVTGEVVDYDRPVEGTFIPDEVGTSEENLKNTAVEGTHYRILGGLIKANEKHGKFKVEIINDDILKENELKLNLVIKPNKDFEAGLAENRSIVITWSRKMMKPATWNAMSIFICATYSTQVYKVFIQATGLKELYYYEGLVSAEEAKVMGRNFGNIVRAYEKENKTPMVHDDGEKKGLPITPTY